MKTYKLYIITIGLWQFNQTYKFSADADRCLHFERQKVKGQSQQQFPAKTLRRKCTKIDSGRGSAPDPMEELIPLPQTT